MSVRLPHVGALPATVEACAAGAVVLVLAVAEPRAQRLGGSEVSVEVTTARGIHRFGGTLELQPGRPDLLRVVLGGEAERIQRRDFARVDAVVPVRVQAVDEPLGGETSTLNVSGNGVLVVDPWRLPLGLDVRIELQVDPAGPRVCALGRVVREAAADQKGIRFEDIARDDEERLIRFVRARELANLRMGRP